MVQGSTCKHNIIIFYYSNTRNKGTIIKQLEQKLKTKYKENCKYYSVQIKSTLLTAYNNLNAHKLFKLQMYNFRFSSVIN